MEQEKEKFLELMEYGIGYYHENMLFKTWELNNGNLEVNMAREIKNLLSKESWAHEKIETPEDIREILIRKMIDLCGENIFTTFSFPRDWLEDNEFMTRLKKILQESGAEEIKPDTNPFPENNIEYWVTCPTERFPAVRKLIEMAEAFYSSVMYWDKEAGVDGEMEITPEDAGMILGCEGAEIKRDRNILILGYRDHSGLFSVQGILIARDTMSDSMAMFMLQNLFHNYFLMDGKIARGKIKELEEYLQNRGIEYYQDSLEKLSVPAMNTILYGEGVDILARRRGQILDYIGHSPLHGKRPKVLHSKRPKV